MRLDELNAIWQYAALYLGLIWNYRSKTTSVLLCPEWYWAKAFGSSQVAWIWWTVGFGGIADNLQPWRCKAALKAADVADVSLRITVLSPDLLTNGLVRSEYVDLIMVRWWVYAKRLALNPIWWFSAIFENYADSKLGCLARMNHIRFHALWNLMRPRVRSNQVAFSKTHLVNRLLPLSSSSRLQCTDLSD